MIRKWLARLKGGQTRSQQVDSEEVEQVEGAGMSQNEDEDEDSREEYYYRITGLNQRQALLNVDEFIAKYNLDNIRDVLRKGATLAHSPDKFWLVEGLNVDDTVALGSEASEERRWFYGYQDICDTATIKGYYLGAILFGGTQLLDTMDLTSDIFKEQPKRLATIIQFAPSLVSPIIGFWLMAFLNRRFGRRVTIKASGACILVGSLASIANSWKFLSTSRLLRGIGMGVLAYISSIYGAEVSTARSRGRAISWWQFVAITGRAAMAGCTMAVDLSGATGNIINIIMASLLLMWVGQTVESPHWLVLNGQMYQAYLSLSRLRKSEVRAARDLYNIYIQTVPEQQCYKNTKTISRLGQLVAIPRLRNAFQASVIVSVSALFTGAQIVDTNLLGRSLAYGIYDPELNISPLYLIIGIWGFILAIGIARTFAAYAIEVHGRRGLLLKTMPHVLWPLLLAVLSDILQNHRSQFTSKGILQILLYSIMNVCGFVPLTYSAEVFPLSHRDVGVPSVDIIAKATPAIFMFIAPSWLTSLSHNLPFLVASAILMVSMIYLFMRETRRYPLEEIPRVFEASSKNIMSYRLYVEFPYLFKRYILRKDVELEHFEDSRYNTGMISLDNIDTTTSV